MSTKIKKDLTVIGSLKKSITPLFLFFSIFSINHCYAVTVGDSFGGGTVFCVSNTQDTSQCSTEAGRSGDYGLIMANEDQANLDSPNKGVTWSSEHTKVPGARSDDNGAANTAAILAEFPHDNPGNNAVWVCHNYIDPKEGHTDWYLPSKWELNEMYVYAKANNLIGKGCTGSKAGGIQCLVGGYKEPNKIYWSSSEYSDYADGSAWFQYFSDGGQFYLSKICFNFAARAIRAFNNLAIQPFNYLLLRGVGAEAREQAEARAKKEAEAKQQAEEARRAEELRAKQAEESARKEAEAQKLRQQEERRQAEAHEQKEQMRVQSPHA